MQVESSLIRLREATAIINKATDDANTKARLEQTWLLQDRLSFPGRVRDTRGLVPLVLIILTTET